MKKQIFTIGYEIPGYYENYIDFNSKKSLMDADILLVSPKEFTPSYENYINFSSGGWGCYNITNSNNYKKQISHLKKEINDFLYSGKNVFIFLAKKEDYSLASSVSSPKKWVNTYNTYIKNNYDFLPLNIGTMISASGKEIKFSGNPIFSEFYTKFKKNLEYQIYVENVSNAQIIFTGKDKTKTLGAIYKVGNGNIITLPYLKDDDKFTEYNEEEEKYYWTGRAIKFGNILIDCLLSIDKQLLQKSEKTPPPKWSNKKEYSSKKVIEIRKKIEENEMKIEKIRSENIKLNKKLEDENVLKDLLFEQWVLLENAVIKALHILDYKAKNYNDGELELDQIIISPEWDRFIGECEGKDSKDINITKFRQLLESLNADFARDDIEERALGILFGNPERFKDPIERTLDFTKKCKIGAEREKIALVKTSDLFVVVNYLNENKDEKFKNACRQAILDGLGKVVIFPEIPRKK